MKKKKQNFLFILLIAMVFHHFIWLFQEPFILSHIVPTIINLNTNTHNQTKKNDNTNKGYVIINEKKKL